MNLKTLKAYSDEEVHGIVATLLQESNEYNEMSNRAMFSYTVWYIEKIISQSSGISEQTRPLENSIRIGR